MKFLVRMWQSGSTVALPTVCATDEPWIKRGRPTGEAVARKEGLVSGNSSPETSIARLVDQPKFIGQAGTAVAESPRLRDSVLSEGTRDTIERFIPQKSAAQDNRPTISVWRKIGSFSDSRREVTVQSKVVLSD